MPVRDGVAHLAAAIESVIGQTLRDIELVIIDDGSTDGTPRVAQTYAQLDRRVRVLHQSPLGLPRTRNRGIRESSAPFIAWLDSDDISLPTRLARQFEFLSTNRDVDVCGTWVEVFGSVRDTWRFPSDDRKIKALLPFNSPFANSSVMLRRSALVRTEVEFDPAFDNAEDYDLWARLAPGCTMANLPQVHVRYRVHCAQNSQDREARMAENSGRVRRRLLGTLGIEPTADELALHQRISSYDFGSSTAAVASTERWLTKLATANSTAIFPEPEFSEILRDRWYLACLTATLVLGPWGRRAYLDSPLSRAPRPVSRRRAARLVAASVRAVVRRPDGSTPA